MAIEYANALMEYIKSEEDEHRLRVIEMCVMLSSFSNTSDSVKGMFPSVTFFMWA